VPVLLLLIASLMIVFAVVLSTPLMLVLRYRAGRARQRARPWLASLNVAAISFSAVLCLTSAAIMEFWAPHSTRYTLAAGGAGILIGILGLALTRWDVTSEGVYFKPSAWLVLLVTLIVAARIAYGAWRTLHAWQAGLDHTSAVVADGVRGSLAAAALVVGYYLIFWIGVARRTRRLQRSRRSA
jgi:hypothetical protein